MINIAHPVVHAKPPIKGCASDRTVDAGIGKSREKRLSRDVSLATVDKPPREGSFDNDKRSATDRTGRVNDSKANPKNRPIADCNRNVLDADSCSFEQLCNTIHDLEKNVAREIAGPNDLDSFVKLDGNEATTVFDERYLGQLEPEKDYSRDNCALTGTTYDDIMTLLESLEDGCTNERRAEPRPSISVHDTFARNQRSTCSEYNSASYTGRHVPEASLKDELATARLQLEEKDAAIKLLREQLKTERASACEKLDSQKKRHSSRLEAQEGKYQSVIKRHQKFIEQLISEKTDLTEKCDSLARRVNEMGTKVQRDLKAAADRHAVELQRAKERYAASEKIRRERWLEAKTSKIKEMTVKGLEPELRSMLDQHQHEMQELRSAHIKELQDTELRIIRRSNQQLEQLRLELTASHEKMLLNEKNLLWARFKQQLDEQDNRHQAECKKLTEDFQRQQANLCQEHEKRVMEKEAAMQQMRTQFEKETEELKRQHQADTKSLKETLQAEWETWLEDYKKEQAAKLERAENRIRGECQSERDRQIELAIKRLEKEARDATVALQQSFDSRLRCMQDKYKAELQAASDSESMFRNQLLATKEALEQARSQLSTTESKLRESTRETNCARELIEKVTQERNDAKKIARQEIEAEKRDLEEKIASLYQELSQNNAQKEALMAQLHSRVKLIITQKLLTIRNLTRELDEMKAKCDHLERLLDHQRKEYILKPL